VCVSACVSACMSLLYVCETVYMCVCERERERDCQKQHVYVYSCTRVCLCICVRGRVIVCAKCKRDTTEILIKSESTLNRLNTIQTYPQVPHVASKTEQLSSGRLHSGKCSCHAKCKKSRRHSPCTRHHGGQERSKPPNVRFTMTTPIKLSMYVYT